MEQTSLCHICLRVDADTRLLEENLLGFLAEIFGFDIAEVQPTYCSKCEHNLRQFYESKNKCVESIKMLKQWKQRKNVNKQPLSILYTLLTEAEKQGSNKIHTAQDVNLKTETDPASEEKPQVIKIKSEINEFGPVNANQNDSNEYTIKITEGINETKERRHPLIEKMEIKLESDDENDLKGPNMFEYDALNRTTYIYEEVAVKDEKDVNKDDKDSIVHVAENDSSNAGNLNNSLKRLNDITDSEDIIDVTVKKEKHPQKAFQKMFNDSSFNSANNVILDDELVGPGKPKKIRLKTVLELTKRDINLDKAFNVEHKIVEKRPVRRRNAPFSKEILKRELLSIFEINKDIKSTDGTVIDKDVILNNIDNLDFYTMKNLYNLTIDSVKDFTPEALKLLAKLQKRYENKYTSIFDTEYLNTEEEIMAEFARRKTYECYVQSPFKCEVCYQGFKYAGLLDTHKKTCHDVSVGDYRCTVCEVRTKTRRQCLKHIAAKHKTVFRCKLCPMITYIRGTMINHYNQHQGVRYECSKCSAVFKSFSALKSHETKSHVTEHVCTLCARTFVSVSGLDFHRNRKHKNSVFPEGEGVTCDVCNIKFASKHVYVDHLRISHEGKKRSPVRRGLNQKEVLTCPVCEASCGGQLPLQRHMRAEHPEHPRPPKPHTHLCDVCGRGFSNITYLKHHRNLHSGLRPFACGTCPAKFHTKMSLWQHEQRHRPPRWHCKDCGKKFCSSPNLLNHKRIHAGDRRFRCTLCPAAFLHAAALTVHVRGVHRQQRRVRKRQRPAEDAVQ